MFTLNAIDHVDDFGLMFDEIFRIIKPGGEFIGGFNIGEPPTVCEPQMLTEEIIRDKLLGRFEIESYRLANGCPGENPYADFFEDNASYNPNEQGFLRVRGRKNG